MGSAIKTACPVGLAAALKTEVGEEAVARATEKQQVEEALSTGNVATALAQREWWGGRGGYGRVGGYR